jgi:hypothetical protein
VARALLEAGASAENIRQPTGREDLDEVLKAVSS